MSAATQHCSTCGSDDPDALSACSNAFHFRAAGSTGLPGRPSRDPLLACRDIVCDRLLRDVPDEVRRWEIGTAVANVLDMAGLLMPPDPDALVAALIDVGVLRAEWSLYPADDPSHARNRVHKRGEPCIVSQYCEPLYRVARVAPLSTPEDSP